MMASDLESLEIRDEGPALQAGATPSGSAAIPDEVETARQISITSEVSKTLPGESGRISGFREDLLRIKLADEVFQAERNRLMLSVDNLLSCSMAGMQQLFAEVPHVNSMSSATTAQTFERSSATTAQTFDRSQSMPTGIGLSSDQCRFPAAVASSIDAGTLSGSTVRASAPVYSDNSSFKSEDQNAADEADSFANPLAVRPKIEKDAGRSSIRKKKAKGAEWATTPMWSDDDESSHRVKAEDVSREKGHTKELHIASRTLWISEYQARVQSCMKHPCFELTVAVLILGNAVMVGFEVDWIVSNPQQKTPATFVALGHIFNAAFGVEITLRLFGWGPSRFFWGNQRWWNCFESLLVLSSILEFLLDVISLSSGNMYSMRMVRLIRITRILRVIRVARIVRLLLALRLLVSQIMGTLRACFWAIVLLVLILYTFGTVFAQISSEFTANEGHDELLMEYWGTVPRSMYTLYKSVSGGVDWENVARLLARVHWFWVAVYNVFLAFTIFAVMNVVVGVFCQSAIQTAAHDHENTIRLKIREKKEFQKKIAHLFYEIDDSGDGELTYGELQSHLNDDSICAYLEYLGLDPSDAWDLFKLLDKDESTLINLEEFLQGCLRLKGHAKVIDVEKLQYENRHMRKRLWMFIRRTEESLRCTEEALVQIRSSVQLLHMLPSAAGKVEQLRYQFTDL